MPASLPLHRKTILAAALAALVAVLPPATAGAFDPEAYHLTRSPAVPRPPVIAPAAVGRPVLRRPDVAARRLRIGLGATAAQALAGATAFPPGPRIAALLPDTATAGRPPDVDLRAMMRIAAAALQGFGYVHAELPGRVAALESDARQERDAERKRAIADLARLWARRAHGR